MFSGVVAVEVFPVIILSVLARHANMMQALNRNFVRPIMKMSGGIALALQMFAAYGSTRETPCRFKQ